MTERDFFKEIQNIYGDYNPSQKTFASQWISKKSEKAITLLFAEILKSVSQMYKVPPGIKEFEEAWKIVLRDHWIELDAPTGQKQIEEETYLPREEAAKLLNETLTKLTGKARYNRDKNKPDETW